MELSLKGAQFIGEFEGFKSKPYLDIAGIPTIGYGTIVYPNGKKVTLKDPSITNEQAISYLKHHVETKINKFLNDRLPDLKQHEFDSLASFIYNLGSGAFAGSTLERRILVNDSCDRITEAFLMWNKAKVNGKLQEVSGLTRRRKAEAKLYCKGLYN